MKCQYIENDVEPCGPEESAHPASRVAPVIG